MEKGDANSATAYLIPYPVKSFSKPILLSTNKTAIGRDPDNDIAIDDRAVSRWHAAITCKAGRFTIMDLKSHNGTQLNGKRVKKAVLKHHDKIAIGNHTFLFMIQSGTSPGAHGQQWGDTTDTILLNDVNVEFSTLLAQEAKHAAKELFRQAEAHAQADTKTVHRAHEHLSMLYQLSEKLRSVKDIDTIIDEGLALILEAIPTAQRSILMLTSGSHAPLEIKAIKYRQGADDDEPATPISRTLLDWVLTEKMVFVSQDVADDARFQASESIRAKKVHSIICVPMMREQNVTGVLYLDSSEFYHRLSQEDAAFAAAGANELALCIENSQLQTQALRNARMAAIGMTVTNLSHNIRNLITLNQNVFDLMDIHIRKLDNPKLKKNWEWIQYGFSGIHRLAVEMLEYAKEPEIRLKPTNINEMILNWRRSLEDSLAQDGITLDYALAENVSHWMMDEIQCHRALMNLVLNAVDAVKGQDKPTIKISTDLNENMHLVISIADNGPGIPQDKLNRISELFFTTKGTKGSGLGLPMVHKFVDQLDGKLEIESKQKLGSVFKMVFPKR